MTVIWHFQRMELVMLMMKPVMTGRVRRGPLVEVVMVPFPSQMSGDFRHLKPPSTTMPTPPVHALPLLPFFVPLHSLALVFAPAPVPSFVVPALVFLGLVFPALVSPAHAVVLLLSFCPLVLVLPLVSPALLPSRFLLASLVSLPLTRLLESTIAYRYSRI